MNIEQGESPTPPEVVWECEVALVRLVECGDEWRKRLTVERVVELVRAHPKANLKRVVERIRGDWAGQPVPANRTPPMILRQCLEWDEVDQGKRVGENAKKNAAWGGGRKTVEERRMERIGGGR